ncbi:hypothetical protein EZV62_012266 [Acer yangbiense]|uniref:DNA-directed RNA polymerase n=1 Tax=Acer yangbiense TaxID=1000413 RepID=A0A5C7HUY8_9ROSI|nr:hypothetical protein EZV62_012266 [Acer yangbiense]
MLYLSPSIDEYYMVVAGNSLALSQGIQEEQVVPTRYRQEFLTISSEWVHLRSISPFQYFSIGASLIPFIEHNDANRALMSSNMQCQAVPLSRSEKCIVGTGLERQVALDSGITAIAELEGKVLYTDIDKIVLSGNEDTIGIPLVMYQRSNKNTCMHQKLQVGRHRCIKKGQVLADGASTVGGELALGKNILVAYMPWEGYNFEDAVSTSKETCLKLPIGGRDRVIDDMPYLQDGRHVDMVFNPLGVPSRMNVGQIFECSLGLAGGLLNRHYRIAPYDERYEQEASRKLVFSKLYEASIQTANPWVFELEGRSKQGGQRVGEMEVSALEGFGVAHILQEMLTYKSDHIRARQEVLGTTIIGGTIPKPEDALGSFRLLIQEV